MLIFLLILFRTLISDSEGYTKATTRIGATVAD